MNYWLRPTDIRLLENAFAASKSSAKISLDLGLTFTEASLDEKNKKIILDGKKYDVPALKKEEKTCFILQEEEDEFARIRFAGSETGQIYELVETAGRPMLKVSATPFHKWDFIKRIEKDELKGVILDAGTGLGYTAIAAAKTAKRIITVEYDPHILEMHKFNPWSKLDLPNIEIVEEDICRFMPSVPDATFDAIILDGGTPRSSGHFFSLENYKHMRRTLKPGATLYHYLPNHGQQRGRDFPSEVIARLETAGFTDIKRYKEENYVVAK